MKQKPMIAALLMALAMPSAALAADVLTPGAASPSRDATGTSRDAYGSDRDATTERPRYPGDDQSSGSMSRDTSTSNVGASTTRDDDPGTFGTGAGGAGPVTGAGSSGSTTDSRESTRETTRESTTRETTRDTSPASAPDARYGSDRDMTGSGASSTTGGGAGSPGSATGASPNEPVQVGPLFMNLDINHDGFISRDEAKRSADITSRFRELDADSDGRVSTTEFRRAEEPRM